MKKYGKRLNLDTIKVDIVDSDVNSRYFGVSEVSTIFTSGKNSVSINGSDLLKPGTEILVEILDFDNNPIYVEVGRTFGKAVYRDGVSIVMSATVYSSTPNGTGTIYIVGTDNNNRTVRWTKKIEINPRLQNTSKVRFYNKPEFLLRPFINVTSQYSTSSTAGIVSTGTFFGTPLNPPVNSRIDYFDNTREELSYQINWMSGTKFSSSMVGSFVNFGTGTNARISDVKNSSIAIIDRPILRNNLVVSTSSTYAINHNPYREYQGDTTKKIGTAEVIFKNIETFTGNVYRYKIFRSSLNAPYDSELVSDGTFFGNELLNDSESPRRATADLGIIHAPSQISTYWKTNHPSITLTHTPDILIDSMEISGLESYTNTNKDRYIIAKLSGSNASYVPYNEDDFSSYDLRTMTTSSYKTNFIRLYKGVEYEISMDLICEKTSSNVDASISFYITSSMPSVLDHKSYDGFGLNIAKFEYKATETNNANRKYFGKVKKSFTINEDLNGTLVIVPSNGAYTVSNISIKPYTDFSLNPQAFTIRVPFDAKTENEGFKVTCELFDINQTSVYRDLKTIQFFDPKGETYPFNLLFSLISGSIGISDDALNTAISAGADLAVFSASYQIQSASFASRITTTATGLTTTNGRVSDLEDIIDSNSVELINGSNEWTIEALSGGDLRIRRLAGSGAIDIGNGTPVKIFGKTVSTGSDNSGGTGFSYLRVAN